MKVEIKWVKADKVPDSDRCVLIHRPTFEPVSVAYHDGANWRDSYGNAVHHIAHWAEMPETPK